YGVNRCLLRPSRRNVRALRCARRAGFRETDFEPADILGRLGLDPSPYRDPALLFRILPVTARLPVARETELWVFIDSEFSSLEAPALLSFGAVTADERTFYAELEQDRKSTRLNSSHGSISYAVFCLKKKTNTDDTRETSDINNNLHELIQLLTITVDITDKESKHDYSRCTSKAKERRRTTESENGDT